MSFAMSIDEHVENMNKYIKKCDDQNYLEQKYHKLTQLNEERSPSILNFSSENLNIPPLNMKQKFNKQSITCWQIINKHTILNICTITLALSCIIIEIFKLPKVLENSKNIQILKRDLEALQRQLYETNFVNEFEAFEQQLYNDRFGATGSGDDTDVDNENSDYEQYDDEDYKTKYLNTKKVDSQISPAINKNTEGIFDDGVKPNEIFDIGVKQNKTNIEFEQSIQNDSLRLYKTGEMLDNFSNRRKRYISSNQSNKQSVALNFTGEIISLNNSQLVNSKSKDEEYKYLDNVKQLRTKRTDNLRIRRNQRQYRKVLDEAEKLTVHRKSGRSNFRNSRQIFAAHYGADSSLFTEEDEHTGNGRSRHNRGIFKAWRPSDWMNDFGMVQYFSFNNDGRLVISETGLYLIYAQIHYLDRHDENGFHVLVNDRPIFQCMVYSPGTDHKSRSCFSAQVALLHNNDHIVLKDIGASRYTLFQNDKSFFGLIKIADMKPPAVHPSQLPETEE